MLNYDFRSEHFGQMESPCDAVLELDHLLEVKTKYVFCVLEPVLSIAFVPPESSDYWAEYVGIGWLERELPFNANIYFALWKQGLQCQ